MRDKDKENQTQWLLSRFGFPAYVPTSRTLLEDSLIHYLAIVFRVKIKPLQIFLTRWRVTTHNLLTGEDQTVSTNNLLYTIMLSQRVVVHNLFTLIVYQRFDQYGSRSIWKNLIFNQGFWMVWKYKLEKGWIDVKDVFFSFSMDFSCMLLFSHLFSFPCCI